SAGVRHAIRARHGAAPGRKIRRHVRQSLHAGWRRCGAQGRAETARPRGASRSHPQKSRRGIHPLEKRYSSSMSRFRASILAVLSVSLLAGQQTVRPKDVRETAKAGSSALPQLQEYLKNPDRDVRVEAVKQIIEIGPPRSLDPLIIATQDNDPEVQMLAT